MIKRLLFFGFIFTVFFIVGLCVKFNLKKINISNGSNFVSMVMKDYDPFLSVKYVTNYDGDTITVNLPSDIPEIFSHEIPVRIRHIDTPEVTGTGRCEKETAQKAKLVTTDLLKNAKRIDLEDIGRDKYFRLLAVVKADGVSIGQYLLDHKLAVPYEGDTKQLVNWCTMKLKR